MATFEVIKTDEVAKLVQFSTGLLNPAAKGLLGFKCHRKLDDPGSISHRKRKFDVVSEINGVRYLGQNHGVADHFSTEACDYYVGVQRKHANKIQIYPAELFKLNPQMEVEAEEKKKETTFRQKRQNLIAQFGSGQKQRKINKALEEKVEDSACANLTESVPQQDPNTAPSTPLVNDTSTSSVVPPHNKDAAEPQDVYLRETLIPQWAFDAVTEQSEVFVNATSDDIIKWRDSQEYMPLIISLVSALPMLDNDAKREQCAVIMYMHCLMFSYNLKARDVQKKDSYPASWKGLVKKLLDQNFVVAISDKGGRARRNRPQTLKDLLLSHILVLYMRVSNYSISLKPLAADLKLPLKRLQTQCEMLGFHTKTGKKETGDTMIAQLKVPLKFPDAMKKRLYKKML